MREIAVAARGVERELRSVFEPTPLQRNAHLSDLYGAEIYLKREDLSPVRSYKLRGAMNAMMVAHVGDDRQSKRFVCASAGNHAQGVAYMCRHFDVHGTIFMPVTTPGQKIAKTQIFGGPNVSIEMSGDYFDETLEAAQEFCSKNNAVFLSPFDDDRVIEGQASVAIEMQDQLGDAARHRRCPGRRWRAGIGNAGCVRNRGAADHSASSPPERRAWLRRSRRASRSRWMRSTTLSMVLPWPASATENWEFLKHINAKDVMGVEPGRLCTTILDMLNTEGIVLEPAGALAVDALKDLSDRAGGKDSRVRHLGRELRF